VVPSAAPAPALVLPTAQAAYLHNPPPAYPAISRRLGEQGRVVVRVWIGVDGGPQKAEIQSGSGYDRLDRVALQTVMGWRFVPGRRGDVPEAMWVSVPIQFQLE
jgi:protein TonB